MAISLQNLVIAQFAQRLFHVAASWFLALQLEFLVKKTDKKWRQRRMSWHTMIGARGNNIVRTSVCNCRIMFSFSSNWHRFCFINWSLRWLLSIICCLSFKEFANSARNSIISCCLQRSRFSLSPRLNSDWRTSCFLSSIKFLCAHRKIKLK